jgi:hypothetical protein
MIINLLGLLTILTMGAAGGILLTIQHYAHLHARLQADEDALAEVAELYAAWAMMRDRPPGGEGPSALDWRDRLPM